MSSYVRDVFGAVSDLAENNYWRHSTDSHERADAATQRKAFWDDFWAAVLGDGPGARRSHRTEPTPARYMGGLLMPRQDALLNRTAEAMDADC